MDQIKNLLVAQAMIDELPTAALYPRLADWGNNELRTACRLDTPIEPKRDANHECGAVGCFGGWVAVTPYFKKQGVTCDEGGAPSMKAGPGDEYNYSGKLYGDGVSKKLFGDPGLFDSQRITEHGLSAREVINKRIKNALRKLIEQGESW